MNRVTVSKTKLLDTLRENRENHVNTFEQVLEDYRTRAVELLEAHIDRIRLGKVEKVNVSLPAPKNYEEEYDKAIAMVEWSEDDHIELDDYIFNQWVMDQWDWKRDFNATTQMYSKGV